MNTQVVLITGALTGIGRAAAIAFAQDGAHVVVSVAGTKKGKSWPPSCKRLAQRLVLPMVTFAKKMMCVIW